MGRLASSSSLPPEFKTALNEFGNRFWQLDTATIANMLPLPSPLLLLLCPVHSLLNQSHSDRLEDTEESSFCGPPLDSLNDFFDPSNRVLDLSNPPIIEGDARWQAGLRSEQPTDGACKVQSHEFGAKKREAVGGYERQVSYRSWRYLSNFISRPRETLYGLAALVIDALPRYGLIMNCNPLSVSKAAIVIAASVS